jgi:hypothetical protein
LSLADIYERVHRRNPSALPEVTQAEIETARRDDRLPLIASEELAYRKCSPLKPLVWSGRPQPDEHEIEVVAGVVFVIPEQKLEPREAYLSELPGSLPAVVKGQVRGESLADPPDQPIEARQDQPIPPNISLADIKFDWINSAASWNDKATGAITKFRGIKARRADVERVWPSAVMQSTQRWVGAEVERMRHDGEIQPGIKRAALTRILKPRLDAAAQAGLVEHTMKQKPLEQALTHWGLWPVVVE